MFNVEPNKDNKLVRMYRYKMNELNFNTFTVILRYRKLSLIEIL